VNELAQGLTQQHKIKTQVFYFDRLTDSTIRNAYNIYTRFLFYLFQYLHFFNQHILTSSKLVIKRDIFLCSAVQ